MRLTACAHGLRLHRGCDNANTMVTAAMTITAVYTAYNITYVPHCRRHARGVAHAHSVGYKQVHDSHHYDKLLLRLALT